MLRQGSWIVSVSSSSFRNERQHCDPARPIALGLRSAGAIGRIFLPTVWLAVATAGPSPSVLGRTNHPNPGPRNKARNPSFTPRPPAPRSALPPGGFRPLSRRSIMEVHMALTNLKLLICALILTESTLAQAGCLKSVSEVKANNVKTRWLETTENDGKPLTISIADGANGLVYSARKAGQPWLRGNVTVCRAGGSVEITLKNTRATSNVPMVARLALPSTQSAHIVNDRIRLGGGGWGGTFIGQ